MESLYVCLFSNGHIKVGRTTNLPARIKQHCDRVACTGAVLTDLSQFVCDGNAAGRERNLIAICAGRADERHLNEWFVGLDFAAVREWAKHCASKPVPDEYAHESTQDSIAEHQDWQVVQRVGPAKVARLLNISLQRVGNWKYRGIPARVRLTHPELFAA